MRLSSSRPSWSTPSQCCDEGPGQQLVPSASRLTCLGEYGAISGAKIAITRKLATMKAPTIAPGFLRSRDHASVQSPPDGALSWISLDSSWTTDMSRQPDPGIEHRV